MSRKNPTTTETLILLPWWVSSTLAVVVFFGGTILQSALPPAARGFAPTIGMLQFAFAIILLLISLKSFVRSFSTKRNLESQSGIESLKELHWKDFENLLAEVFRRQGFSVEEQLGGGADGGVDLVLNEDGRKTLVQCKLRTNRSVGIPVARELYGTITAERAFSGILVTTSAFTSEVHRFAVDKPIRLIAGSELLDLIRAVQKSPRTNAKDISRPSLTDDQACPACGKSMVLRTAKRGRNAGGRFWGCSGFPKCQKTINI